MIRSLRPQSLCVVISSILSFPISAATTILPGETFDNTGYLSNYDQLDNQGHLINSGVIDNFGFNVAGAQFNNWSVTDNSGSINFHQNSSLNTYNLFNNDISGRIEFFSVTQVLNTGTFNNSGNINSYTYYSPNSEFTNTHVLNNFGVISNVDIKNSGNINNQQHIASDNILNNVTGVISNLVTGGISVFKSFVNYGVLNNEGLITLSTNANGSASLQNSGTVNNTGNILGQAQGAEINNSGLFNNENTVDAAQHLVINNSGTFNNGAAISPLFGITGYGSGLVINNSGVFNNNRTIDANNVTINNSGRFENNSGVMLSGLNNQVGSVFNNQLMMNFNSTRNNTYPMLQPIMNNAGEFNNNGTVRLGTGYGYRSDVALSNTGVFNNNGQLNLDTNGGRFILNNQGTFNQAGRFDTNRTGITVNNFGVFNNGQNPYGNNLQLGNDGVINNQGEFNSWGEIQGGGNSEINNTGRFNSTGSIRSLSRLKNEGVLSLNVGDSDIESATNSSTGVINNYSNGSSWFNGVTITQVFNNQGTINNVGKLTINRGYSNQPVINNGVINNVADRAYSHLGDPSLVIYSDFSNLGVLNNSARANVSMHSNSNTNSGTINNDGLLTVGPSLNSEGVITGVGEIWGNLKITEAGTLASGSTDMMLYGREMDIRGNIELNGTLAMDDIFYEQLNVFGNVSLGANSILDFAFYDSSYFRLGQTFDLVSAYDITGGFGSFSYETLFDNNLALQWSILEGYGMGDLLRVSVVSAVPVPAAVWLFMSGLAGLVGVSRRRKHLMH